MFNLISLFNRFVLCIFGFLYKYCKFESLEDKFHKYKKNNKFMNKVKFDFVNNKDFNIVKKNTLDIINNVNFLEKYDITSDSIFNNSNNKLVISFKDNCNCICVDFNHYFISGPNMFILFNKMVNSNPPNFLQTNPFLGFIYLPFYLYELSLLKKKEYVQTKKYISHVIVEQNITTKNKRYYLYDSILKKVYKSLQMKRPMVVGLSVGFDEIPYIKNNVGLIIINYDINDTIEKSRLSSIL